MEFRLRSHTRLTIKLFQFVFFLASFILIEPVMTVLTETLALQFCPIRAFTRFDINSLCYYLFMLIIEALSQFFILSKSTQVYFELLFLSVPSR